MADEQRIKAAKKQKDGWWASIFSGPAANIFLYLIADIKWITPNHVTSFSLLLCFLSSILIGTGKTQLLIIAAILVQLVFIFDCLDGQLARYRSQSSNFGAWFDRVTDRLKDFLIYFSIAWGHYHIYNDWKIWPLAMAAMFFVFLFDYYVNQDIKLEAKDQLQVLNIKTKSLFENAMKSIFSIGEMIYKSVPILQFHIGEQYLLISLFLLFGQTRLLLYFVVILGVFYSIYWPLAKYNGRKP